MNQQEQPVSKEEKKNTESVKEDPEEKQVVPVTTATPMDIDPTTTTTAPSQTNGNTAVTSSPPLITTTAPVITHTPSAVTEQPTTTQELDAINQLQLAHAAAALSGTNNFPFLANFENTIGVMTSTDTTSGANTNTLHALSPNTQSSSQQSSRQRQAQQTDLSQLPTELLKRELMNQKVRADNRERKKRWRQQNEERNKDNDLRCRVNKRAHKLFGKEDSEHKKKWIEEEFLKRQQKRKEKERRRGLVDDSLGGHAEGALNNNSGLDLAALAQHLAPQQHLPSITDANYLTLLCNNLGIPAAARNLLGNMASGQTDQPQDAQVQQPEQQQQQESEGNTNQPSTTAMPTENTSEQDLVKDENKDARASLQPFPFQLLEILQHLHQYQPQNGSEQGESSANNDFQLAQAFNHGLGAIGDRPEEKLAALLATTIQQAATVAAASQVKEEGGHELSDNKDANSTTTTNATAENTNNTTQDGTNNNAEFPMDAVLTLMQLNAGWRQ